MKSCIAITVGERREAANAAKMRSSTLSLSRTFLQAAGLQIAVPTWMLQFGGFGDANSVLRRCGPHKLAKAFASCLGNAATALQPLELLSPGLPYETLASPQSLFQSSPMDLEQKHRAGHIQDDYFPLTTLSRSNEPLVPVPENAHARKRKPRLLLVEDNIINLQVSRSRGL
jgi:hypothetical protein